MLTTLMIAAAAQASFTATLERHEIGRAHV